jgi:hypothetical protein
VEVADTDGNDRAGMCCELDSCASPEQGAVSAWRNEMAEFGWLNWLTFDGLQVARLVEVPTLMVHGDNCVLPDNVRTVHKNLAGPSGLVWADGQQANFYDQPAQVGLAVDAAVRHSRKTLS